MGAAALTCSASVCPRAAAGIALQKAHTFGCRASLTPAAKQANRQSRGTLLIRNNELNKWGDIDGRDDDTDPAELDDGFERDTSAVLMKVLTARATQKVLMQLQELDLHVATWLSEFCSKHPPGGGDKFLLELMRMGSLDLHDVTNKMSHRVSPADLVDRILLTRADMAHRIGASYTPRYMEMLNRDLKVKHLSNSYTSGSTPSARGRGGDRRRR